MNRNLSNEEMDALLSSEHVGHLGVTDGNIPYVVPMGYIYHENVIYGQTTDGKKIDILRKNPLACFQVERVEAQEWRSVICWGSYQEVDFSDSKMQKSDASGMAQLLTMRLDEIQKAKGIHVPFIFEHGIRPLTVNGKTSHLFRIVIAEKTGRLHQRS